MFQNILGLFLFLTLLWRSSEERTCSVSSEIKGDCKSIKAREYQIDGVFIDFHHPHHTTADINNSNSLKIRIKKQVRYKKPDTIRTTQIRNQFNYDVEASEEKMMSHITKSRMFFPSRNNLPQYQNNLPQFPNNPPQFQTNPSHYQNNFNSYNEAFAHVPQQQTSYVMSLDQFNSPPQQQSQQPYGSSQIMGKFQNQNTLPPQIRPETGQFLPTPMPPQDHGDLLPPDMKQGPVSGGIRPKQNMMRPNLQPLNTFQQTSQPVVNRDVEKSQSNLSKGKTSAKEPLRLQNINGGSGIVATKKEFETALGDKNKENPPYAGDNTKFEHAEDDPNDIHDDEEVGTQADEDVHNYAYPPKQYPLLRCFHNPSVKFHKMHIYMYICEYKCYACCNITLNNLMVDTYEELKADPNFSTCNINQIASKLQSQTQKQFKTPFETIVSFKDFAQKVHFGGDLICKIEIGGKFLIAYATPYSTTHIKPPEIDGKKPHQQVIKDDDTAGSATTSFPSLQATHDNKYDNEHPTSRPRRHLQNN